MSYFVEYNRTIANVLKNEFYATVSYITTLEMVWWEGAKSTDQPNLLKLRHEIVKAYNTINQDIFAVGVSEQKVELLGNKFIITARHKRAAVLQTLDQEYHTMGRCVDTFLVEVFKSRLKLKLQPILNQQITTILKDYDPLSERSLTVIFLDETNEQ